jgi:hypothetical protein
VQRVVGELLHIAAVGVHDEDLPVQAAVARGLEGDATPVRRPRRRAVERRVVGQGDHVRAVRARHVDLLVPARRDPVVIAAEQQAGPVGREGRIALVAGTHDQRSGAGLARDGTGR